MHRASKIAWTSAIVAGGPASKPAVASLPPLPPLSVPPVGLAPPLGVDPPDPVIEVDPAVALLPPTALMVEELLLHAQHNDKMAIRSITIARMARTSSKTRSRASGTRMLGHR